MTERQRMTREQRREQVERCLAADMTVREWCRINHVADSTMYRWMALFRKEEPGMFADPTCGEWIELSRDSMAARTALAVRPDGDVAGSGAEAASDETSRADVAGALVVRVNGADVVVPEGVSETHLSMALRAVAKL